MSSDYSYVIAGGEPQIIPGITHRHREIFSLVQYINERAGAPADILLGVMRDKNADLQRTSAFLTGREVVDRYAHERTDWQEIETARNQVLQLITSNLESAEAATRHLPSTPWPQGLAHLSPAEVLYAVLRIYAGRNEYAAWAEVETASFIAEVARQAGCTFVDVTASKTVNQPGPDGIFVGAAQAFGLSQHYAGLEVKTVVSDGSLRGTLKTLRGRFERDRDSFRADTQDRGAARLNKMVGDQAKRLKREIMSAPPEEFATMLVIRECGLDALRPDAWVYEAFDIVLIFNVFNRIRWETSTSWSDPAFQAWLDQANRAFLEHRAQAYMHSLGIDVSRVTGW